MLIQSEYDIQFYLPAPTAMVALLHLHPTLDSFLRGTDDLHVESHPTHGFGPNPGQNNGAVTVPTTEYIDSFGNRCSRFVAPAGHLRLSGVNVLNADPNPDQIHHHARQHPIEELPSDVLQFLLPSRYCQVDQFGGIAQDLFANTVSGWDRATAIRDWVHDHVTFNYNAARPTKTSMDVFTERIGVCRDFQHLAITLSRCMNIPARYVTGYIGDIRRPYSGAGDFSAWYQVYLNGQWINLDARHNYPRQGRLLMAVGRDAADVAITTSFGTANLTRFYVESNEIDAAGNRVPLPVAGQPLDYPPIERNTPTQSNYRGASPTQTQSAVS
ncbi:Transglutaminase-like enzyme, putative cysteine protease [Granulicella rosea]|uniref:Transglutaminase-like enzyme, putative cysteine protease n=1 Tax=Granulicella rosea TaxID=474952 RepID=A0A239MGF6_9BACT|nr:transglutaminase family protein [Granulicella rosea]SNT41192.1 Transglutaminase-like enzyme, putative cysteine protease [Granulicella rosea]